MADSYDIRPPVFESQSTAAARVMNLRNAMLQNQEGQLELHEKVRVLQQAAAARQAIAEDARQQMAASPQQGTLAGAVAPQQAPLPSAGAPAGGTPAPGTPGGPPGVPLAAAPAAAPAPGPAGSAAAMNWASSGSASAPAPDRPSNQTLAGTMAAAPQQAQAPQPVPQPVQQQPNGSALLPGEAQMRQRVLKLQSLGALEQASAIKDDFYKTQSERGVASKDYAEGAANDAKRLKEKSDQVQDAMQAVTSLPPEQQPAAYAQREAQLVHDGWLQPGEAEPFPGVDALANHYLSLKAFQDKADLAAKQGAESRAAALAKPQLDKANAEATSAGVTAGQMTTLGMPLDKSQEIAETRRRDAATASNQRGELAVSQARQADSHKAMQGATDANALDMMADAVHAGAPISDYVKTRGNAAQVQTNQILTRIGEKYGPTNMALASAGYHADKGSLTKLQAQRDQVVSFENTAVKNMDQFTGLAKGLLDTHVPWLNTPVRLLDEKLVGRDNISAVNAARQVMNNEFAKINSGAMGNAPLSDAARKEVNDLNPQNATMGQILSISKVLKTDAGNRHASLDDMIGEIKKRIGGAPTGGGAAPAKKTADPLGIR